jgi:hypothetical protein
MRFRQWRRRALVLALAALAATVGRPLGARADGAPEPPGAHEHVRKIGPQAVVIVDDQGRARMYDAPSEQARACKSAAACWGQALGALGFFGAMTYEDLTRSVEVGSQTVEPVGAAE